MVCVIQRITFVLLNYNTMTQTTQTVKAGKHTLTIDSYGNKATVRVNGVAICFNSIGWRVLVANVAAGKYDDYIKNYCTK